MNPNILLRILFFLFSVFTSFSVQSQTVKWAFSVGQGSVDISHTVYNNKKGFIYVVGGFSGLNVDFDPSVATHFLSSSSGSRDIYIAKYTRVGEFQRMP